MSARASGSPRFLSVVGARPNLVKMAPVVAELRGPLPDARHVVVHTGQHFDPLLSAVFIDGLGIPPPDHALCVGSGSHAVQTARVLERLEPVLVAEAPDLVFVAGDVNSTPAAALATAKLGIPLAHVEAGLRSLDRTMPEEINRVVTDQLSELLFLHSDEVDDNLPAEGIRDERLHLVGNTMIDTLVAMEPSSRSPDAAAALGVRPGEFLLVTQHRPALVEGDLLGPAIDALGAVARELPVLFASIRERARRSAGARSRPAFACSSRSATSSSPRSPATRRRCSRTRVECRRRRPTSASPPSRCAHTPSGRIRQGTDTLLGLVPERIREVPTLLAARRPAHAGPQPLWDGRASERVVDVVAELAR
jgi:UDP-N-acetylglucosamine 2-epimerase (non-hydrolysing)